MIKAMIDRIKFWQKRKIILSSGLFDPVYYLKENEDVRKARVDPLTHYLKYGEKEGRKPNIVFNPARYLDFYQDLNKENCEPLFHYILHGEKEGRVTSLYFDQVWYSEKYQQAKGHPQGILKHFLSIGLKENLQPSKKFDPEFYLAEYPDVSLSGVNPLNHFLHYGVKEGRKAVGNVKTTKIPLPTLLQTIIASRLFDQKFYHKQLNSAGVEAEPSLLHYVSEGEREGFKPNELFDPNWYLAINKDVKQAGMSPLYHYIKYGEKSNRKPCKEFEPFWYLDIHKDVKNARISPLTHYLNNGKKEGRVPYEQVIPKFNACSRVVERCKNQWNEEREKLFISYLLDAKANQEHISQAKASIIMPTYNREDTIGSSIESVLSQTHKNFELIIVDDGSIDQTATIVESFTDDRINYIRQQNKGVSAARNTGLKAAKGDYVFFLDSDNRWRSNYLDYMLVFLEDRKIESAYCGIALTDDFETFNSFIGEDFELTSLQKQNYIDLNCFCFKVTGEKFFFDESIKRLVDWDFILTIALEKQLYYAPFIGVDYYHGDAHARITNSEVLKSNEFIELQQYVQNKCIDKLTKLVKNKQIKKINKIAIVLHIYHQDNLDFILDKLAQVNFDFDLFITTSLDLDELLFVSVYKKAPQATVLQFSKVGEDIGAFIAMQPTLAKYNYTLKLHNREAPFAFDLMKRIIFCEMIPFLEKNISTLSKQNLVALGPKQLLIKASNKEENREKMQFILKENEIFKGEWGYFINSMFFLKTSALHPFINYCYKKTGKLNQFIKGDFEKVANNLLGYFLFKDSRKNIFLLTEEGDKVETFNQSKPLKEKTPKEIIEQANQTYLSFAPQIKKGQVIFFPDYRETNPYQTLVYSGIEQLFNIQPGSIQDALKLQKNQSEPVVFHLQWTTPIISGPSKDDIREKVRVFVKDLKELLEQGGIVVWTIHNIISHDTKNKEIEVELCQKIAELASYIHVHSERVKELVAPYYNIPGKKLITGPLGHYKGIYPDSIDRDYARKKLGYSNDSLVFIFLGQVRDYKGVDSLVDKFLLCKEANPNKDIKLIIAGKPVHYSTENIVKLSEDNDHIKLELRLISDDEMQLFLRAADFMVTPFKQILTSSTVYLSLSYGLPVISPKKGLITEVLNETNSLLYDSEEGQDLLLEAMQQAIDLSPKELSCLKQGAAHTAENLPWNLIQDQISRSFMQSLLPKAAIKKVNLTNEVSHQIVVREAQPNNTDVETAEVGVVILHYQHIEDTIRAIKSVESQHQVCKKIFVISNDENLNAFIILASMFNQIELIQAPGNLGYAAGNNIAIELIVKEGIKNILVLNPDAELSPGSLKKMLDYKQTNPDVGVLGPKIVYGDSPKTVWFAGATVSFEKGLETHHVGIGNSTEDISDQPVESDYITGACMLIDSQVIEKIGLMPEQYFLYFEETDFCLQAKKMNFDLMVFPDIEVKHYKRSEHGGVPSLYYLYYFCRNALLMTAKYCPEKIELTENSLKEKAQHWLKRVSSIQPEKLEQSKYAVKAGIEDGHKQISGKVDLTQRLSR